MINGLQGPTTTRRGFLRGSAAGLSAVMFSSGILALLEACGQSGSSTTVSGKPGGILGFGMDQYPAGFNPFVFYGASATMVNSSMHHGLIKYDHDGNIKPDIATAWDLSSDGLSFTFHIRKDAHFHDRSAITAQDVTASLNYILTKSHSTYLYDQFTAVIASLEAVDSGTVRIRLKQPSATFLQILADPHVPVVSAASLLTNNPDNFVGAGPFVLKTKENGTSVQVVKNAAYYFAGLPKLDGIKFVAYADENLRVNALKAGDINLINFVPWHSWNDISSDKKLVLDVIQYGAFTALLLNHTAPPFDNPAVRQAIGYAIDRTTVLKTALAGHGEVLNGVPFIPSGALYQKNYADFWTYDPEKAKSMLAAAGYPNGLSVTLLTDSLSSQHRDTGVAVQASMNASGQKVALDAPDYPTFVARAGKGQYQFAVTNGTGLINDPDYLSNLISGINTFSRPWGFHNSEIDNLFVQGRGTLDVNARKQIYGQLATVFLQTVPLMPLTWRPQAYAYTDSVRGFHNYKGLLTFDAGYDLDETTIG
jgi:ABC-type transport system substrate-binding protein